MIVLGVASAAEVPDAKWAESHMAAATVFAEGVQYSYAGGFKVDLSGGSDHVLFKDNFVQPLVFMDLNPALLRGGVGVTLAPVAVYDVTFRASDAMYFGAFTTFAPMAGPDSTGSRAERQESVDELGHVIGTGTRYDIEMKFKMKAGPFIGVFNPSWRFFRGVRRPTEAFDYVWEATENLVIDARNDTVLDQKAFLLYEVVAPDGPGAKKLWAGPILMHSRSVATDDENLRLGPGVFWKPGDSPMVPEMIITSILWLQTRSQVLLLPNTIVLATWTR